MIPSQAAPTKSPDFTAFERRAKAGERLNIAFFGASLTWGAGASDPQRTSYRAQLARKFETFYPKAHFRFFDGAIGGTGSQLGVFRLERDVLGFKPDLIFLDFTLNDGLNGSDEETLASYESLVRRIVTQANCPLVSVFFPDAATARAVAAQSPARVIAHGRIAKHYGCGTGDAVALIRARVASGAAKIAELWPDSNDQTHPGDKGYELYAEAAWDGFQGAIARKLRPTAPTQRLYASTYENWARVRLSSLGAVDGWIIGRPNRISAWFDSLMSRWLDDEIIAAPGAKPLRLRFRGSVAILWGEGTPKSGRYRVTLDGKTTEYDAGTLARAAGGNVRYLETLAQGLNPDEHVLEIESLLQDGQELRIESICVAGGKATVSQD